MSTGKNKEVILRFDDVVMNQRNLVALDEFVAQDVIDHQVPPGLPPGIEGKRQFLGMLLNAFPDLHITIEGDLIAEGDYVAERWTLEGTHQGELIGIPATGKRVKVAGMSISRLVDGKQVEHWSVMDQFGLLQQIGVIPMPG
ncbi:MAG: ester cyclase [Gammaproteobacteria bacterium]|nr:ester cyclase [Gammaproteobacteria bacterium]